MTMLVSPVSHEASLPSLGDNYYPVLGDPMHLIVGCIIEARSQFAEGLRCHFWNEVVEAEFPELFDADPIRALTIDPSDVLLANQYSSYASDLKPTRLFEFED